MNHIKAFKKLEKIEIENDIWSYKIDDIFIWPLIKFNLFRQMTGKANKNSSFINLIISQIKNYGILNLIKSKIDFKKPIKAESIAFSMPDARRKLNDVFYDILFDKMAKNDKSFIIFEWPVPIKHFKNNYTNNEQIRYLDYLFIKIEILSTIFSFFKKYKINLKQDIVSEKKLNQLITSQIIRYKLFYKIMIKMLKQNTSIKKIYLKCCYSAAHQALIRASKECNIETIELQHGIISKYHPAYIYKKRITNRNKLWPFTDKLHVFGQATKEIIINNSMTYRYNEIETFGYLKNLKELYSKTGQEQIYKKLKITKELSEKRKILITSQWLTKTELKKFLSALLKDELIKKDYLIIYKTHPREENPRKEYGYFLKYKNFFLTDDIPVYALFNIADIHSSYFSTCVYESLYWGIPNILIKSEDSKNVSDLENKEGIYFSSDLKTYKKYLREIELKPEIRQTIKEMSKKYYE